MSKQLRATVVRRQPLPIDEFVKLLLEQVRASKTPSRQVQKPDEGERGAA
jgi:hypothetical protein